MGLKEGVLEGIEEYGLVDPPAPIVQVIICRDVLIVNCRSDMNVGIVIQIENLLPSLYKHFCVPIPNTYQVSTDFLIHNRDCLIRTMASADADRISLYCLSTLQNIDVESEKIECQVMTIYLIFVQT